MERNDAHEDRELGYAWYVAIVLMACNTLSFIDRQILGLLVTPIKAELGISDTQIGLLQGLAFGIFYTLLGHPDGPHRRPRAAGATWWPPASSAGALMTALCAGARSFGALFLARMGVGVGEATLSPSAFSLLSDYFPKGRLATALSIFSMGIFFGSGLALILGGLIIGAVGSWRLDVPDRRPAGPADGAPRAHDPGAAAAQSAAHERTARRRRWASRTSSRQVQAALALGRRRSASASRPRRSATTRSRPGCRPTSSASTAGRCARPA